MRCFDYSYLFPNSYSCFPSSHSAYKNYFKFGLAVTFKGELDQENTRKGIVHQAETITLGNALKPDFLFAWQNPREKMTKFTDSTGKTIDVPAHLPKFKDMDTILTLAKENNLKIRGHVLTWHSQTPHWFFTEGYSSSKDAPYVDKETMTARQEWYIKEVLEHCTTGKYEGMFYGFDVVNEAISDATGSYRTDEEAGGSLNDDTHGSKSSWWKVYQSNQYIINAFTYARKYAPKGCKLFINE